jgi:hypothetical protein
MLLTILGIWVSGSFVVFGILGLVNRDVGLLRRAMDLNRRLDFRRELSRMLRRDRSRLTFGYGNWPDGK